MLRRVSERRVGVGDEQRIQYYHRNVTAQLIADGFHFMLDAESQLPGEGEVAAAMRLLERVIADYPRSFDVVVADALYAKSNFFKLVVERKKDAIVVLKENCPELLKDAIRCFDGQPPMCSWDTVKGKQAKGKLNAGTKAALKQVLRAVSPFGL